MRIIIILLLTFTSVITAKEKEVDCDNDLNICRAGCYDKNDMTGDCILDCYDKNSKCLKEKFK